MKTSHGLMDLLSLLLPVVIIVSAQLRYRWPYFVLTGAAAAFIPCLSEWAMKGSSGPTGMGVMLMNVLFIALMAGMHGIKLLVACFEWSSGRWGDSRAGWVVTGLFLGIGTIVFFIERSALLWLPLLVVPAAIQVTVQLPSGPGFDTVHLWIVGVTTAIVMVLAKFAGGFAAAFLAVAAFMTVLAYGIAHATRAALACLDRRELRETSAARP